MFTCVAIYIAVCNADNFKGYDDIFDLFQIKMVKSWSKLGSELCGNVVTFTNIFDDVH